MRTTRLFQIRWHRWLTPEDRLTPILSGIGPRTTAAQRFSARAFLFIFISSFSAYRRSSGEAEARRAIGICWVRVDHNDRVPLGLFAGRNTNRGRLVF